MTREQLLDDLKDATGDKMRHVVALQRKAKERVERLQTIVNEYEYLYRYIKALYKPQNQPEALSVAEVDNMLANVEWLIDEPESVPASLFRQLKVVLLNLKAEVLARQLEQDGMLAHVPSDDLDEAAAE